MSEFIITAAYHSSLANRHPDWDREISSKLDGMSFLLGITNPIAICGDVAGCVLFYREEPVLSFPDPPNHPEYDLKIIDSAEEMNFLIQWQDVHYKVVETITIGTGEFGDAAQAATTFRSIVIEDATPADTWAHEFGHTQGIIAHRSDGCTNAIMYSGEDQGLDRDEINESERDKFILNPDISHYYMCHGKGPVLVRYFTAEVTSGTCTVRFRTDDEFEMEGFRVSRLDPLGDSLKAVGDLLPSGSGGSVEYQVLDTAGQVGDRYYLFETRSASGREYLVGECVARGDSTVVSSEMGWHDADSLAAVVLQIEESVPAPDSMACSDPPRYGIIVPDSLASYMVPYVSMWLSRGVDAGLIPLSKVAECGGSIRDFIRQAHGNGLEYVLLVGDANDAVLWDDPGAWNYPGWHWVMRNCNGTSEHVPSDSARNIIPTFYFPDHDAIPAGSMSTWTPYYASDLPYADVDNDGMPDVKLGRLPVVDRQGINAYTAKLSSFLNESSNSIRRTAYHLGYFRDQGFAARGAETGWLIDSVAAAVPAGVTLSRYYGGMSTFHYSSFDIRGDGELAQFDTGQRWDYRMDEAATWAFGARGGVVIWQSTMTSSVIWPGWSIFNGWTTAFLAPTQQPVVSIGLSCGMGNFDQTEYSERDWCNVGRLRPIAERVLLDPARGAIVVIGPTRGSWQVGNMLFGREIVSRVFQQGTNVGAAFLGTVRSGYVKYPRYRDLFRSYVLLGDPLVGDESLMPSGIATGRGETSTSRIAISLIRPNPFNGVVSFSVASGENGVASVSVYSIAGRRIRKLDDTRLSAGQTKTITWDGRVEGGGQASSGLYFLVARQGANKSVARIALVK
jgi:hypothetical protein